MSLVALGPWPCPREITARESSISISDAKRINMPVGSAPVDKTKTIGVILLES